MARSAWLEGLLMAERMAAEGADDMAMRLAADGKFRWDMETPPWTAMEYTRGVWAYIEHRRRLEDLDA